MNKIFLLERSVWSTSEWEAIGIFSTLDKARTAIKGSSWRNIKSNCWEGSTGCYADGSIKYFSITELELDKLTSGRGE